MLYGLVVRHIGNDPGGANSVLLRDLASGRFGAMDSAEFSGRVALVTGGAGDGIGSATAMRLAKAGASVVIFDSHEKRTRQVSERIAAETGARVIGLPGDIADRARVDEVLASA